MNVKIGRLVLKFLSMLKNKKNAVDLLQQMSKRAEKLSPIEQANSFVAIRRIDGALKNRDNRIIFGRRGTGKTHIISYVANSVRLNDEVPCVIDMRTIGSNNSIYYDVNKSASVRSTTLIRDLISAIYEGILEYYTSPESNLRHKDFAESLDKLSACIKTVEVVESYEAKERASDQSAKEVAAGGALEASLTEISLSVQGHSKASREGQSEWETTFRGKIRYSINMGDAATCLNDISSKMGCRLWILLDEWSSLPEDIQPYLADFIKRAIFPISGITVQIAAIEYRSKFRLVDSPDRIGIELGSDVSADINLDDYFVYDSNPTTAAEFFENLLYRHLHTFAGDSGLKEKNSREVVSAIFSQEKAFIELTRASEGVARDFINILQIAAMRSDQSKISINEIRAAAKDWFERDKQRNLDTNTNAQALLEWIRDKVIETKKARAFLLNSSESNQDIEFLFDERVLHIAKRSYSAKDEPGVRYQVWKIDYGCYVDLINTAKNPTGLLFEGSDFNDAGEIIVPDDDYRAVRRAILNLSEFASEMDERV